MSKKWSTMAQGWASQRMTENGQKNDPKMAVHGQNLHKMAQNCTEGPKMARKMVWTKNMREWVKISFNDPQSGQQQISMLWKLTDMNKIRSGWRRRMEENAPNIADSPKLAQKRPIRTIITCLTVILAVNYCGHCGSSREGGEELITKKSWHPPFHEKNVVQWIFRQ